MSFVTALKKAVSHNPLTFGVLFVLVAISRIAAPITRWPVITFVVAYAIARATTTAWTSLVAASLLSVGIWVLAMSAGYQRSRRRQLTDLLSTLSERRGQYRIAQGLTKELSEVFVKEFAPKHTAQKQAGKMAGEDIASADFLVLVPDAGAHSLKLLPPRAFPNYRDESIILYPGRTSLAAVQPFQRFLIYHEIEHCTPDAFKIDGSDLVGPARAFTFGALLILTVSSLSIAISAAAFVIALLLVDYKILRPAQLECRTDLRALAKLSSDEREVVIDKLKRFLDCRRDQTSRSILAAIAVNSSWLIRKGLLDIIVSSRDAFGVTEGPVFKAMGNLSLFEAAYSLPMLAIALLPFYVDVSLNPWVLIPFVLGIAYLFVAQGQAGIEGDKLLSDVRSTLNSLSVEDERAAQTSHATENVGSPTRA